jgi:hypothetical protein
MITIQNVAVSAFAASGRNIDMLDTHSVQQNFNNIQAEFFRVDDVAMKLDKRMTELESFTHWVAKNHPHVIHEYVVTEATKEKIGVK